MNEEEWHHNSMSCSEIEIVEEEEDDGGGGGHDGPNPMATISEEEQEQEDSVYVAVGKGDTSMEALSWTLNNLATRSTILYLIHVFPEIKNIPNPLGVGMIPRNQVSAEQVESYMAQERGKRRELLQKFLQSCSNSKVKGETILIESDMVAKAILDLIPILHVRKLVIGANKFHLRKSRSSRKVNGVADKILQNAPESCEVRIICEGKEVNEQMMMVMSPSPQVLTVTEASTSAIDDTSMTPKERHQSDLVSCICFKPKFK